MPRACYETSVVVRAIALLAICCAACAGDGGPADGGKTDGSQGALDPACTLDPKVMAASCPNDQPAACPSVVPSYASSVAPAIERHCVPCHGPGGMTAGLPFKTYQQVYNARGDILDKLTRCIMPPVCAPQLSHGQRRSLLQWLVCDAPDN